MNYKQDRINLFLYELQLLSKIEGLDQKQVYLQLINYGIPKKEQKTDLSNIFSILINKYKSNKKIQVLENDSFYSIKKIPSKNKGEENNSNPIEIHVPLCLKNIEKSANKIIDFIIKSKINHYTKLSKKLRTDSLVITVYNEQDAEKITSFINQNKDLTNDMYEIIPFNITDNKIYLTMSNMLSYNDILSKYIYSYMMLCNENNKSAEFEDFLSYLYTRILEFTTKDDLSKQIAMLDEKYDLPNSLMSLEQITTLIYFNLDYIKNNKNVKDMFYDQYEQNYNEDKYIDFTEENFTKDKKLLEEIITTMSYKYGYDDTKKALHIYRESKSTDGISYITNDKNLRTRVKQSKTFRTYINGYTNEELDEELDKLKPTIEEEQQEKIKTQKEMILEEVCKQTYLACQTEERNYSGEQQVAIALAKMKNNDYNYVTNDCNVRTMARQNIKPEEVEKIIKKTLEGYIIEEKEDLYLIYASRIAYLCNKKKGRK